MQVELVLRTLSKRTVVDMCLSAFWRFDVVTVVPEYVGLCLYAASDVHIDRCTKGASTEDGSLEVA